jgi:predicted thioesterase
MTDATLRFTVSEEDTAAALGSGSLPVFGTPRLLAWCEAATCAAIEPALGEGETSVGTRVELEHIRPSAVGARIEVTASPVFRNGRLHRFSVIAREVERNDDGTSADLDSGVAGRVAGRVVGRGEITRVIVDADRFLARLRPT